MPLIELLHIKSFNLHSQLEQRQRLKNLDRWFHSNSLDQLPDASSMHRFKNTPNSVLLATDVAARGLDIPSVDHVIHFQIPRTAETYIHRTGRTARAMRKGFSMLMVAPDERRVVSALLRSLCRGWSSFPSVNGFWFLFLNKLVDEEDISVMSVELSMLDKLKARVQLARRIELAQHKTKKVKHDRKWVKETAEVLGVELDSDFVKSVFFPLMFPASNLSWLLFSLLLLSVNPRVKIHRISNEKDETGSWKQWKLNFGRCFRNPSLFTVSLRNI